MKSIGQWCAETHELSCRKGWWEGEVVQAGNPRRVPETLMLVVSELAEALECYRKGDGTGVTYMVGMKPEGFPIEIADAVIRIFDLCGALGIDLECAIELKHEYNKTRPYRHGGKKA